MEREAAKAGVCAAGVCTASTALVCVSGRLGSRKQPFAPTLGGRELVSAAVASISVRSYQSRCLRGHFVLTQAISIQSLPLAKGMLATDTGQSSPNNVSSTRRRAFRIFSAAAFSLPHLPPCVTMSVCPSQSPLFTGTPVCSRTRTRIMTG